MIQSSPTHSSATDKIDKETANSLSRQWAILSNLPSGKWIGTRDLQQRLNEAGFEVSLRTIQRDLNQIAERFPIENNGATPQGWRWRHDAPIQSLPHMTNSQAVTFMMVEEHLNHLLPPSFLSEIRPWFDLARASLSNQHSSVRRWVNRVRIIPATQPLIPPIINLQAQTAIYEALLNDRQLECHYSGRNHSKSHRTYVLNPLGLVQKGTSIYLICTRVDRQEIQTFVLHRFKAAKVLDTRAIYPKEFNLDEYIESGQLGFRVNLQQPTKQVDLKLTLKQYDATIFFESKLAKNQRIHLLDDDYVQILATLPLTSQLVWWLRGFGKKIVHIEPASVAQLVWEDRS